MVVPTLLHVTCYMLHGKQRIKNEKLQKWIRINYYIIEAKVLFEWNDKGKSVQIISLISR